MKASIKRPPTPDGEIELDREPTLQEIVNIKLTESGEKERLKELLRERLVECGWKDEMKALCREFARKKGRNNVTVDDLINVITPKGRGEFFPIHLCIFELLIGEPKAFAQIASDFDMGFYLQFLIPSLCCCTYCYHAF
ncbi:hypothetical protein CDL12_18072 [Handroanthus impetiginosus]|uniref:Transcription and mRNA export factor ENY2 n=1 Tax=Handroanthus impetiginosus TaxID=429701 RepID=A0A2G9GVN4_9LAMI|nr:hypothetical protein CDL12_18072 [Handroanthus impetiginosus]